MLLYVCRVIRQNYEEKYNFPFLERRKMFQCATILVLVLYSVDGDGSTSFNERSRIRYAQKTSRFFLN